MVPETWSVTDITFCDFRPFFALSLLNNLENQNFKKLKKKNCLDISFYTSVPKIIIICNTVPETWCAMNVIFIFHSGKKSKNKPKKSKYKKSEKDTWEYHHFAHVYYKNYDHDILFLRYGVQWTDGCTDGQMNGRTDRK